MGHWLIEMLVLLHGGIIISNLKTTEYLSLSPSCGFINV